MRISSYPRRIQKYNFLNPKYFKLVENTNQQVLKMLNFEDSSYTPKEHIEYGWGRTGTKYSGLHFKTEVQNIHKVFGEELKAAQFEEHLKFLAIRAPRLRETKWCEILFQTREIALFSDREFYEEEYVDVMDLVSKIKEVVDGVSSKDVKANSNFIIIESSFCCPIGQMICIMCSI